MSEIQYRERPRHAVAGKAARHGAVSHGAPMSMSDLPSPDTKRWTIRRKAAVVAGTRANLITIEEACRRYTLSIEEFLSWQRMIDRHGIRGLRTTKIQDYRQPQGDADRSEE